MVKLEGPPFDVQRDLGPYFQSIKASFEATLAADELKTNVYDGSSITIPCFLLLLFSLIPVIPALAYLAVHRVLRPVVLNFRGQHSVPIHSFLFWYIFCSALFGVVFGIRLLFSSFQKKRSTPKIDNDELLNAPQMRFALCFSVILEIEAYRTNKLSLHIERAKNYWRKFIRSLQDHLGGRSFWNEEMVFAHADPAMSGEILRRRSLEGNQFFPQVHTLLEIFSWFRLEPQTEAIILAFDGLRSKLRSRIIAKKDLFQVSECLCPLSLYLFAQIPDISDTEEDKTRFAEIEKIALDSFAQVMTQMIPYEPERLDLQGVRNAVSKEARLKSLVSSSVGNSSVFIRFVSMWLILQLFIGIAVAIFTSAMKNVKFDSTMLALLIGTPLAISAALTAIPAYSRSGGEDSKAL